MIYNLILLIRSTIQTFSSKIYLHNKLKIKWSKFAFYLLYNINLILLCNFAFDFYIQTQIQTKLNLILFFYIFIFLNINTIKSSYKANKFIKI